MYSLDHTILRDTPVSAQIKHRLDRKPLRVATLLDEATFLKLGHLLQHNKTVFFEDRFHDWNYIPVDESNPMGPGDFYYYTRIALRADVLLVFELSKTSPQEVQSI